MASSTQQVLAQFSMHSGRNRALSARCPPLTSYTALKCKSNARNVVSQSILPQQLLSADVQRRDVSASATPATASQATNPKVAKLEGTPEKFSISEDKLIQLAKTLFEKGSGVEDESLLSDDFRFEFPVVSLPRDKYLEAVRSFDLKGAMPDMNANPYHWRVDPYEPNRVWFTTRVTATHTGTLKFGSAEYKATGKSVQGAPECLSFVFNEDGKCSSYTGGYVMDRRVGNTKKMGALFGILAAIGAPVPEPGSLKFKVLQGLNGAKEFVTGIFSKIFGGQKQLAN